MLHATFSSLGGPIEFEYINFSSFYTVNTKLNISVAALFLHTSALPSTTERAMHLWI